MRRWALPLTALAAAFLVCALGTVLIGRTAYRAASALEAGVADHAEATLVTLGKAWAPPTKETALTARFRDDLASEGGKARWAALSITPRVTGAKAKVESLRFDSAAEGGPKSRAILRVVAEPSSKVYRMNFIQDGTVWKLDEIETLP